MLEIEKKTRSILLNVKYDQILQAKDIFQKAFSILTNVGLDKVSKQMMQYLLDFFEVLKLKANDEFKKTVVDTLN